MKPSSRFVRRGHVVCALGLVVGAHSALAGCSSASDATGDGGAGRLGSSTGSGSGSSPSSTSMQGSGTSPSQSQQDSGSPTHSSPTPEGGASTDAGSASDTGAACAPSNVVVSTPLLISAPSEVFSIAVADVNHDGRDDVLFVAESGTLGVALSTGGSAFATAMTFEGSGGGALAVGDLDGDGWADVLSPGNDDGNVVLQWAKNNADGKGTFGAFQMVTEISNTGDWDRLADMNGDGKLDIINFGDTGIEVLLNSGGGTFGNPQEIASSAGWQAVLGNDDVAEGIVADVNGDGAADVLLLDHDSGICVSLNQDHGASFADPVCYPQTANQNPFSVAAADLRGKGLIDIVTGGQGPDDFNVFLNKGGTSGTFSAAMPVTPNAMSLQIIELDVADVNHDGKPDLVGFDTNGNGPYVSLGNGDGTFSTNLATYSAGQGGNSGYTLTHGDFNGDGFVGIAVVDQNMTTSAPNGGVQVLFTSCAK